MVSLYGCKDMYEIRGTPPKFTALIGFGLGGQSLNVAKTSHFQ